MRMTEPIVRNAPRSLHRTSGCTNSPGALAAGKAGPWQVRGTRRAGEAGPGFLREALMRGRRGEEEEAKGLGVPGSELQ